MDKRWKFAMKLFALVVSISYWRSFCRP